MLPLPLLLRVRAASLPSLTRVVLRRWRHSVAAPGFDWNAVDAMMSANVDHLQRDLTSLQCGRATPSMLSSVRVNAYGSTMPLDAVGAVVAKGASMLVVKVHDPAVCSAVKKAIDTAGLNVFSRVEGSTVLVPIPKTTQDTREKLAKLASEKAEKARIDLRHSRKRAMDMAKQVEAELGKDAVFRIQRKIDDVSDSFQEKVSKLVKDKQTALLNA